MTTGPTTWAARRPTDLEGSRPNATGLTMWVCETDPQGRAYLTITADAPAGDLLMATARYESYYAALDQLPDALDRFERTTLANWDHPAATYQRVRCRLGWFLTIGREPGCLPLIRLVRVTAKARMRSGWDQYDVTSIISTAPVDLLT